MTAAPTLLCIVTGSEGYGVRQVWSDVLNGLSARGWNVVVAVLDSTRADEWSDAFPQAKVVPSPRAAAMPGVALGRWARLLSMARRVRRQLNHVTWLARLAVETGASTLVIQSPPESLLAGIVARRVGLRALWLVPNAIGSDVPFDLNRRAYRLIFRLGKVVPVSNSRYTDSTFGTGSFERHVVHLGVDTDRFEPGGDPTPVRDKLGIPASVPVIGLFARMTASKGQDRLIEALALSATNFHLILCGGPLEGAYVATMRDRITSLGLGERVHFAGLQKDLRPYYAACDVIANLRVDPEPFGLTIIEAMSCGKPVLAHGSGGPEEIVLDGETGWLLPDAKIATVAAALRRIWSERDAWPPLGRNAIDRVRKHFRKATFVEGISALALDAGTQGIRRFDSHGSQRR